MQKKTIQKDEQKKINQQTNKKPMLFKNLVAYKFLRI